MSADTATIVIVEDDLSVREMLTSVLEHEGYVVEAHADGSDLARHPERLAGVGLAIIDVGLPGVDGIDLCRRLRTAGRNEAILMLTARGEVVDRVAGLDAGADDYLVKPFALSELLARVRALQRWATGTPQTASLTLGDLVVDPDTRKVLRDGDEVELTRLEFDVLALLVRASPRVLTRDLLHETVWGSESSFMSNSLDVCVSQLRRKLEAAGQPRLIHTVRGVGFAAWAE